MNDKRKYLLICVVAVVLFLYVLCTEVADRWSDAIKLYSDLRKGRAAALTPDQLVQKRNELIRRKNILAARTTRELGEYWESVPGFLEFLNRCAKGDNIRIESVVPSQSHADDQVEELKFKIDFTSDFHRAASFLNAVENGAIPVQIKSIGMILESAASSTLQLNAEGIAKVVSQHDLK